MSVHLGKLIAVVGLRGGSMATGGLSANVAVRDWPEDFSFVIGDHCCRRRSSIARFLSPRVSKLRWIDARISELRLEVEDGEELFDSVLGAAGAAASQVIQFTGEHLKGFALLYGMQSFSMCLS
jgi:hypothetical protein